jgi:hypothetical protein
MTMSVYNLHEHENNATGAGSSVVVECENVLLPSLGKTIKVLPFCLKEE